MKITDDVSDQLSEQEKSDLNEMLDYIRGWDGNFEVESIAATIYSRWDI